jgi:PAS domain S-box-containing protein
VVTIPAAGHLLTIAESGGDIAWVVDLPAGELSYLSPGVAQLSGYTAEQWCARDGAAAPLLAALMAGLPARLSLLAAGDTNRRRLVRQLELPHREGHKVPVEIISTVTLDEAGAPAAVVGLVRDLSCRREYEAGQRRFASMLNHEFRTPLSTIDGAIQRLLVTGAAADPATLDRYRKIGNAVDQLIGMLEQYLSPDVVAASGTAARADRVNPRRLLEEGAVVVRAAGREALLDLGDLPDSVRGEPQGLRLAIKVLVDNALQYGPPGLPIRLTGATTASGIRLTVADQGAGVPAGEDTAIFGKHVRGSNSAAVPGTGLGLYMARSVVEVHGGAITMERTGDTPGDAVCMTEFSICLPIRTSVGKDVASAGHSSDNSSNKY